MLSTKLLMPHIKIIILCACAARITISEKTGRSPLDLILLHRDVYAVGLSRHKVVRLLIINGELCERVTKNLFVPLHFRCSEPTLAWRRTNLPTEPKPPPPLLRLLPPPLSLLRP